MDTIHRLHRFLKNKASSITTSKRSTYYTLNSSITIRVSDHFAASSDGQFSIITTFNNESFILVKKSSGICKIVNYEEVKKFINLVILFEGFLPKPENDSVSASQFTGHQLKVIKGWGIKFD